MKTSISLLLATCFLLHAEFTHSQANNPEVTEITVTATRLDIPLNELASSATIITKEEIEDIQGTTIIDALQLDPSLSINRTGGPGSSTTVAIRGANPEHSLVILDGIELNNPILPSRSFNFADLAVTDIDRIEILRGPQSTLYGGDAMGGVINIMSAETTKPFDLYASSEAGSYDTYIERAGLGASNDISAIRFSIYREDSGGISAADASAGNAEHDGYENTTYSTRGHVEPVDGQRLAFVLRAVQSDSELDNSGGAFGDDPNRRQENEQYFFGTSLTSNFLDEALASVLSFTLSDQSFEDNNDPDAINSDLLRSEYSGRLTSVQEQLTYKFSRATQLLIGGQSQEESGDSRYRSDGSFGPFENNFSERSATTNSLFSQLRLGLEDNYFVVSGLRLDEHSAFGSELTWSIAPTVLLSESGTKLFSTVGSGYKAPSLFQLYSNFGSEDLDAESSLGVDAGIEQKVYGDNIRLGLTYFHQEFDDLINFEPNTFIYSNISEARTQGLETSIAAEICEFATLRLAYTYLDATNLETGEALLRRARHQGSVQLSMQPVDRLSVGILNTIRGSQVDNDFSTVPASRQRLGGYGLLSVFSDYKLQDGLSLFARVENILDKEYEEVLGYGTLGAAAFAGVRIEY